MVDASVLLVSCDVAPGTTVLGTMAIAVDSVKMGEVESLVLIPVEMSGDIVD